jgi:hypothetical protein
MRGWHGERLIFIGDTTHATSPQLGQGANLALRDAMYLADAFADRVLEISAQPEVSLETGALLVVGPASCARRSRSTSSPSSAPA